VVRLGVETFGNPVEEHSDRADSAVLFELDHISARSSATGATGPIPQSVFAARGARFHGPGRRAMTDPGTGRRTLEDSFERK
jgi:hypothetical protein